MLETDRRFIENKYHKTDEPFDPFRRMAYHGYDFDISTGLSDDEIRLGLERLSEETEKYPHPIAKAMAVKYVLENTRIDISEHDYFVGFYSLDRLASGVTQQKWYSEVFDKIIPEAKTAMDRMNDGGTVTIWPDFDHVVPDWRSLLELGFSGILSRAERYRRMHEEQGTLDKEKSAFFDGIIIEYKAIISVIDRLYRLAAKQTHKKAERIANCLKSIRDGAPRNIYEAMQVIYIYFIVSECFDSYQVRSLGNGLDASLYPFYKRDIEDGAFSRDEIKELLGYFMLQWSAIGNYWGQPFYLGGTNKDGSTKYGELSSDILEVYESLNIFNPKIQLKVNENTPTEILDRAFGMVRGGMGNLVFVCEPGMIKAVMSYGASYDEALDMDIRGCYETGVRANEVSSGTGYINSLKAVEYVIRDDIDPENMGRLKFSELETFDDFYNAVLKKQSEFIELTIKTANEYEKYLGYINPSSMYSGTVEGSLKKGVDAYQCGVKFNNSAILNCGFASLVDSVMAVKEFVYDKKAVTHDEMKKALEDDWQGHEALRTMVLKSKHKYGNGDPETDRYAEAMASYFASKVNGRPNARGGVYKAIMHSARQYIVQGEKTGATPDGRRAGDEISKNASPSVGMDRNGVTALIESAAKLRPYTYPESFCLDVMLHPSAVGGDEGLKIMRSLLFTYMKKGGMSIQFNVFDADMLRDAQKHPEKYRNLQVRVCGWNVLWNDLSETEQEAYIKRAENII